MLQRPMARSFKARPCQFCELISCQRLQITKRSFTALGVCKEKARAPRSQHLQNFNASVGRALSTSKILRAWDIAQAVQTSSEKEDGQANHVQQGDRGGITDLAGLIAAVDRVVRAFTALQGIPSEKTTLAALQACSQQDPKALMDSEAKIETPSNREGQSQSTASHLLDLDRKGKMTATAAVVQSKAPVRLQDAIDKLSDAAYKIITFPAVFITPRLLEEYVKIQVRLGKPETLPHVFSLYASKPLPRLVSGTVRYVKPNLARTTNAVDPNVAEIALDSAIETKNINAAIGIIEHTYAAKAFIRHKIVRRGLLPFSALTMVPFATYALASNFSVWQDTMDPRSATAVAFAGILAYVGFTGSIGLVAVTTANDQMDRVTWASGTPLTQRWLREDERAALDKVACSFGFSEEYRHGEEAGAEFQGLREYIMRRRMMLDAVELMEGMN